MWSTEINLPIAAKNSSSSSLLSFLNVPSNLVIIVINLFEWIRFSKTTYLLIHKNWKTNSTQTSTQVRGVQNSPFLFFKKRTRHELKQR